MNNPLNQQLKSNVMRIIDPCKHCGSTGTLLSFIGMDESKESTSECTTCSGKKYVEQYELDEYGYPYSKPLTLQQILLALSKEYLGQPLFLEKDIIVIYENPDAYEDCFAIPLDIEPSQYPDELINKLIQITL